MTEPVRIQRKRTKGFRMPPNTISVCRPGRWGNPWRVGMWKGYSATDQVTMSLWPFVLSGNIAKIINPIHDSNPSNPKAALYPLALA